MLTKLTSLVLGTCVQNTNLICLHAIPLVTIDLHNIRTSTNVLYADDIVIIIFLFQTLPSLTLSMVMND
jgi:hypothetical protein